MFALQYYDIILDCSKNIKNTELDKIKEAGQIAEHSVENGGLIHVFGCGHSHMVSEELFYRAGGLVPVDPIFEESAMLHAGARKSSKIERMTGYAVLVADNYEIKEDDVLIVCSTSGINSFAIEMADEGMKRGAKVIGISSGEYLSEPSRDIKGRHLPDVCDLFIDNHVPHGDAVIQVSKEVKAGPVSSICSFYIANSIVLGVCENMKEKGIIPPVYMSGNIEGGDEYNDKILNQYVNRIKSL